MKNKFKQQQHNTFSMFVGWCVKNKKDKNLTNIIYSFKTRKKSFKNTELFFFKYEIIINNILRKKEKLHKILK